MTRAEPDGRVEAGPLAVMYRGPLASCNYACGYCPFAKRKDSKEQLARDRESLEKFTGWIAAQTHREWRILFTPWGEALVRGWYRRAIAELTRLPHARSVAAQTNLSSGLDWIAECRVERLSLWATFHPSETTETRFVARVRRLRARGVRLSVGVVAATQPGTVEAIESLRRALPDDVYLWINAQHPRPRPYADDEAKRLAAIDPLFPRTVERRASRGEFCRAGETSFTVDGRGDIRRCHFVDRVIGNIRDADWERALAPRACPNRFCSCFLGKAQLDADALSPFFGDGLLARLPPADFRFEPATG